MQIWKSNYTGSQLLSIRIRPIDTTLIPLTCSIHYGISDTWLAGTLTASVTDFDSNDFLNLSASLYQKENIVAGYEVYQVSGSNLKHNLLYRGNIEFLNESTINRTSEPFISYTGSSTEYIIY